MSNINVEFEITKADKTEIDSISSKCETDTDKLYDTVNKLYVYFSPAQTTTKNITIPEYIDINFFLENDKLFLTNNQPKACSVGTTPLIYGLAGDDKKYTSGTDVYNCIQDGVGFDINSANNKINKTNFLWANSKAITRHMGGANYFGQPVAMYPIDVYWSVPIHIEITGTKTFYSNGEEKGKDTYKYRETVLFTKHQGFWVCRARSDQDNTTITGYTTNIKLGKQNKQLGVGSYSNSKQTDTQQGWIRAQKNIGNRTFDIHHLGLAYAMDSEKYETQLEKVLQAPGNVATTFPRKIDLILKDEDLFIINANIGYHLFGDDEGFFEKSKPVTEKDVSDTISEIKNKVRNAMNSFLVYGPYKGYHERKDWENKTKNDHDMHDGDIDPKQLPITDKIAPLNQSDLDIKNINTRLIHNGLNDKNNCDYYIYSIDIENDVSISTGDININAIKLLQVSPKFTGLSKESSTVTFYNNIDNWDYESSLAEYFSAVFKGVPDSEDAILDIKRFVSSTSNTRVIESYLKSLAAAFEKLENNRLAIAIDSLDAKKIQEIKNNDHLQGSWEY